MIITTLTFAACSGSGIDAEKYHALGPIILEANRYYAAELEQHPTAAINGESYMSVLKIKATRAFYRLEPYRVEVRPWKLGKKSGFSVALFDGGRAILFDCSDTPEIDYWLFDESEAPARLKMDPPCGWPVEITDE